MEDRSKATSIRRALGQALLRRHQEKSGSLDLQAIADAEDVVIEEVHEQMEILDQHGLLYKRFAIYTPDDITPLDRGDRNLNSA